MAGFEPEGAAYYTNQDLQEDYRSSTQENAQVSPPRESICSVPCSVQTVGVFDIYTDIYTSIGRHTGQQVGWLLSRSLLSRSRKTSNSSCEATLRPAPTASRIATSCAATWPSRMTGTVQGSNGRREGQRSPRSFYVVLKSWSRTFG
jgi:hypothetical protein